MAKKGTFDDPSLSPQLPTGDVVFGQVLGARYRLDEQLSVTDEVALWRGWDEQLGRIVLVYVLPPNHPRTAEVLTAARDASVVTDARFLRVLDALEYGPSEPVSFVVCECVLGYDLCDLLSVGPLGGKAATWLVRECAEAITALHAEGNAHGHLDLAAVDVTPRGTVRISGFVLDDFVADTDADKSGVTLADLQARDVRGLGQILFTALTGSWPQLDAGAPPDFGVPVIRRGVHGLAAPSQLRSTIPPVLDFICAQILAPMPDNPPLETAEDVLTMLQQVLGAAEASDDLALRVQALVVAVEPDYDATGGLRDATGRLRAEADDQDTPTGLIATARSLPIRVTPAPVTSVDLVLDAYEDSLGRVVSSGGVPSGGRQSSSTGDFAGLADAGTAPSASADLGSNHSGSYHQTSSRSLPVTDGQWAENGDPSQFAGAGSAGGDRSAVRLDSSDPAAASSNSTTIEIGPLRFQLGISAITLHRIIAGVGALVLIVAAFLVFRSCGADPEPGVTTPSARATGLATVASIVDFDPEVDGGSGGENWDTVANAVDDNLTTLWYTETYEFPETSRRKPGTGLVLGFESAIDLAGVSLWTDNSGATIQILVPKANAEADAPPMDTVESWRELATMSMDTDQHTFTFDTGTKTRWIMVYITVVPPVEGGYAIGIREISVHQYIS